MGNLLGIFRQEEQDDRPPTPPIYSGYHQSFRTSKTSDKTFRIADPRQLSTSCEQVLDVTGGDLKLLNATLFVHPFSVDEPVHMSVKEMDYTSKRRLQILTAGYNEIMRPGMHLCLQPHGLRFLHPVTLELTNTDFYSHVKILVFQKEIYPAGEGDTEPNIEADWTDVTDEYSPEIKDNNVVLTIGSFSLLETIKVVIPALSLGIVAGIAIGYRLRACALLNDHLAPCNFYVYYKLNDPFLTVFAEAQHSGGDWKHKTLIQSQHVLVGHGSSNYSLMDEEMLLFYYDTCQKLVGAFPLKLKKCKENGQHFQVPICARSIEDLPACFYIRRRLSDVIPEQDLCEIQLKIHPNPSMESTWQKLIRIRRVFVMQHLDVLDILPQLRQDNIINVRQQEELLAFPAKETQAGKLLDIISTKDFTAFKCFIEAMQDGYPFIANKLWQEFQDSNAAAKLHVGQTLDPQADQTMNLTIAEG